MNRKRYDIMSKILITLAVCASVPTPAYSTLVTGDPINGYETFTNDVDDLTWLRFNMDQLRDNTLASRIAKDTGKRIRTCDQGRIRKVSRRPGVSIRD